MEEEKKINEEFEEMPDTQIIPDLSDEEADDREYELIDETEEGGL